MISKIQSHNLQAIIYTCIGYGAFTLSDALVKFLVKSYSIFFVLFASSLVSLIIVSIYGLFKYGYLGFKTKNIKLHLIRGAAVIGTGSMNALAFKTLRLDEFYAIVFSTPFILSLMSFFILKEPISKKQLYGIIVGFLCIIYMVRPGADLFKTGTLFVGIGVCFYTVNCLITRVLKAKEPLFLLPFFSSLSILIFASSMLFILPESNFPDTIPNKNLLLFLSVGFIGTMGMVFVSLGLQKAHVVASVAPFHYTQIIWGIILGYLIFDDIPTLTTLIGATGLIITGLYVLNHERKNNS